MARHRPLLWCSTLVLVLAAPVAFAQNPNTTAPASGTPAPIAAKPAASPPAKKTKKKPAKVGKKLADPEQPADTAAAVETTKVEPEIVYRTASLIPVKSSVYHKAEHKDELDQFYATVRFSKIYNFAHEVVVEPMFRTKRTNPGQWDPDFIQQAYIDSQLSQRFSITSGKKLETEGSGFFLSPSDLLNENKDVFDPIYQKEGIVFSRLKYRLNDWSIGLGFIPRVSGSSQEGRGWLTASAEILETDIHLQVTEQPAQKTTTGLSVQRFFGGAFELHFDGRYQARQRLQTAADGGQPEQFSSYSGANPASYADDTPSGFYLGGTRYVFTPKRTLVCEYIQNQAGLLPVEFKNYFDGLRDQEKNKGVINDPPTRLLGRHYGFVTYQDDETLNSTHFAVFALVNTDDQSRFTSASLRYTISALTSVELAPTWYSGKVDSEFGEMPFSQAIYLVFRGRF